jgi:hypothetical protein
MEGARCLIYAKSIPLELWGEAIACAVYTLSGVSTKTAPNTPYQNWFGSKPDVSNLRIFGSTAYITCQRQKEESSILKASHVFSSDTAPHKRHTVFGTHSQGR